MKFVLRNTKVEEFVFSPNNIKVQPNEKFNLATHINRRHFKLNDTQYVVVLIAAIENTEQNPSPFNVVAAFSGLFEVTDLKGDADFRKFIIEASKVLYPHLCSLFANVTTLARFPGLQLPFKTGAIFPEDEDKFAFVIGGNENPENKAN